MPVSLNLTGQIHDLQAVVPETDWFRASVLPEVGAKIYDLVWKLAGRNLLWHNPRILPQTYPIDGAFDNYWCGGWDDGFPTCDPCDYRGELYPGLGELRSLRWQVQDSCADREKVSVRLFTFGPISPVICGEDGQSPEPRITAGMRRCI